MSIRDFQAKLRNDSGHVFETLRKLTELKAAAVSAVAFAEWHPWPRVGGQAGAGS